MHRPRPAHGFGVRTSVAVTDARGPGGRFVPGAKTLPGNPHDGHSLAARIGQVARLTGRPVRRAHVDRGCRGHGVAREGRQVVVSRTRGLTSPAIRREIGAIAPEPTASSRRSVMGRSRRWKDASIFFRSPKLARCCACCPMTRTTSTRRFASN